MYEAELADVNRLLGKTDSTVSTQTEIAGYSGGGYVTGLSDRAVTEGGGIRNTVVVMKADCITSLCAIIRRGGEPTFM